MKNIHEVPDRLQQNRRLVESKGGKLIGFYALMGEWDLLGITEFPDEKSAMSALITIGKTGRATTHTMTAISGEDFFALARNA